MGVPKNYPTLPSREGFFLSRKPSRLAPARLLDKLAPRSFTSYRATMIATVLANPVFLSSLLASVTAQAVKTLIDVWRHRRFDWRWMLRGAGMPSSHTATVVGLTASVWLSEGPTTVFFVTLALSAIVVRDVIGDKVFAAHQEKIINEFLSDLALGRPIQWKHLIGHTVVEVAAGFAVGLGVAWAVFLRG